MATSSWQRVLLKLSGRFLADPPEPLLSLTKLKETSGIIAAVYKKHQPLQLTIVVGAGNLLRGRDLNQVVSKPTAHGLGMMSTMINAAALAEALRNAGVQAEFLSTVHIPQLTETFTGRRGLQLLKEGKILVVGGGTGFRYMSTDTAGVVIAGQLKCQVVLKATDVDGVYDADPQKHPKAKRYEGLSFDKALAQNLQVMDPAAFALAREVGVPIIVFDFSDPTAFDCLLAGETLGTKVGDVPSTPLSNSPES